jgi:hypothetical protein
MEMSQSNTLYSYLKHTKMSFFFSKNRKQEGNAGPVRGLVPVWGWRGGGYKERVEEDEYAGNIMYSCMNKENMRPTEGLIPFQEWGYRGKGE